MQPHYPSVASGADGVMDLEAWLREPMFLADIDWVEWRRHFGKSHRWTIESTMIERSHASLQPPWDWKQRGWVEDGHTPLSQR